MGLEDSRERPRRRNRVHVDSKLIETQEKLSGVDENTKGSFKAVWRSRYKQMIHCH